MIANMYMNAPFFFVFLFFLFPNLWTLKINLFFFFMAFNWDVYDEQNSSYNLIY